MLGKIRMRLGLVKRKVLRVGKRLEKIKDASLGTERNWAGLPAAEQRAYFAGLSPSKQRDFFEDNGFLWVPSVLTASEVAEMHQDIKTHGIVGTTEEIWAAASFHSLIDNKKTLDALRAILGEDLRLFKVAYAGTLPNKVLTKPKRNALHVDYGIGETLEDWRNSAATWINVGYQLTDLSAEHSPFWVVPGSNRFYHVTPWTDMEAFGDDARMVPAKAGDALLFHGLTIHATSANVSRETRHALFFSYRPAWSRHLGPVKEWPQEFIDSMPESRRKLLLGLNRGSDIPRNTI